MKLHKAKPHIFYPGGNPASLVRRARARKLWRPTVVFWGKNQSQWLGISQWRFRRGKDHPCLDAELLTGYVKGGIEDGEKPKVALRREIEEEVGLSKSDLGRLRFIGYLLVPYDKRDRIRDGYKKGKLWLIYVGEVIHRDRVCPNRGHAVASAVWVNDPRDVLRKHGEKSNRKYEAFSHPAFLKLVGLKPGGGG